MSQKDIYYFCKDLGCCDACCLRYIGIKNPNAYEDATNFVLQYQDENRVKEAIIDENDTVNIPNSEDIIIDSCQNIENNLVDIKDDDNKTVEQNVNDKVLDTKSEAGVMDINSTAIGQLKNDTGNTLIYINKSDQNANSGLKIEVTQDDGDNTAINGRSPPCKKRKLDICVSCLGILQENTWQESYNMVKEVIDKKGYDSNSFACALSAPIATLLRERAVTLRLADKFTGYDIRILTALKEAWKWSFGVKLGKYINKILDSGAVSPLLITVNFDYIDDLQELEILKQVSPQLFEERSKQKRRFVTEFTRRSVEQALEKATLESLQLAGGGLPAVCARAFCVSVVCAHAPLYLGGRYIKLSRNLPQSPWILEGKRVLPSSVQEIIYGPIAKLYKLDPEEADRRLKLIAAGREDVHVRCLGEGRPFAIEISDPTRSLTAEELARVCSEISDSGDVIVKQIVSITKEDLVQLKKGEETKSKTYEALCIKLSHSKYEDILPEAPIKVTQEDISRINAFRNTPENMESISENLHQGPQKNLISAEDCQEISESIQNKKVQKITDSEKLPISNIHELKTTTDTNTAKFAEESKGVQTIDSNVKNSSKDQDNADVRLTIKQKTPIRVLHRRPLLTRTRHILELKAIEVPDNPQLFRLFVRTSAGTYVKEWVHGELGRSRPSLCDAIDAKVDLLALDVTAVHLDWPPIK